MEQSFYKFIIGTLLVFSGPIATLYAEIALATTNCAYTLLIFIVIIFHIGGYIGFYLVFSLTETPFKYTEEEVEWALPSTFIIFGQIVFDIVLIYASINYSLA